MNFETLCPLMKDRILDKSNDTLVVDKNLNGSFFDKFEFGEKTFEPMCFFNNFYNSTIFTLNVGSGYSWLLFTASYNDNVIECNEIASS